MGRWKSGAPTELAPRFDDPALAADDKRNNAFTTYSDQDVCPFAAHTRKMNPRGDITQSLLNLHRILRRGIPFGPEVTDKERTDKKTELERGLLFVSYQSALDGQPNTRGGFAFLQKSELFFLFLSFIPLFSLLPPGGGGCIYKRSPSVRYRQRC